MSGTLVRSQSPLTRGKTLSAARPSPASAKTQSAVVKPEEHAQSDGYIPFKIRFQAWWEGVEPGAIVRKGQKQQSVAPERAIELDSEPELPPETILGAARVRICDQVWGDGFAQPGGATYGLEHAGSFPRGAKSEVLDLSAGLGGRITELATENGFKVTGMDRDEELVDYAQQRAELAQLDNVKTITQYNPDRLNLRGLKYDGIVARDVFFTVPEKLGLMGTIRGGLRQGGILALTDFVLAEHDQNEGPVMEQWQETEPVRPMPWSIDEYHDCLTALHFDILNFEDDTDAYRDLIVSAWHGFANGLDSNGLDRAFVDALIPEAELWMHRVRALESGQLRLLKATVCNSRAS